MGLEAPLGRIGDNRLASLLVLIDCMELTPRLTDQEVGALYKPYFQRLLRVMAETGETLGKVRGGTLSFLSEAKDRIEVTAKDNDFEWQTGVVSGCFSEFLATGEIPPPHYVWRVCVLLRRAGLKEIELRFLAAWDKHFAGRGCGRTYDALSERYFKLSRKLVPQGDEIAV